jgi:TolA-binding protein
MSARDPFGVDPEDLGVRARRGLLSRAEQRELERVTDASASLRIAYEVGRDLDGVAAVRGGDDALIANAASAALLRVTRERAAGAAEPTRARRSGRRVSAAVVALAVLTASGAAAALWGSVAGWVPGAAKPSLPAAALASARRAHGTKLRAAPTAARAIAPEVLEAEDVASVSAQPQARPRHKGAAELFHAANAARREGSFARAVQLYAELRSSYPDAAESELARVSLGQLLLARGDAAGAEREFGRYLARGRGQLVEEALLGRAQSLERLGRAREERASLTRLLSEFPHSVYAAQARARLEALERGATISPH